jgi:hypothetical protein
MILKTIEEIKEYLTNKINKSEIDFTNLELKSEWNQDYGKKISGMANRTQSHSFFLIIGVNDKGIPLGKDEKWVKITEEQISNHFNQYLDPIQTNKTIDCLKYEVDKYIIIIESFTPNTVVLWNKKSYKMAGTTCTEMTPAEIMELTVSYPERYDFTGQVANSDINYDYVKSFIEKIVKENNTPSFNLLSEYS